MTDVSYKNQVIDTEINISYSGSQIRLVTIRDGVCRRGEWVGASIYSFAPLPGVPCSKRRTTCLQPDWVSQAALVMLVTLSVKLGLHF